MVCVGVVGVMVKYKEGNFKYHIMIRNFSKRGFLSENYLRRRAKNLQVLAYSTSLGNYSLSHENLKINWQGRYILCFLVSFSKSLWWLGCFSCFLPNRLSRSISYYHNHISLQLEILRIFFTYSISFHLQKNLGWKAGEIFYRWIDWLRAVARLTWCR